MEFVFFILIVFVGAALQSGIGFGFGVIAMALFPMFMDYSKAMLLMQLVAVSSASYLSIKLRKKIRWDVLFPMLIPTLIITTFVSIYSLHVDSTVLFTLLGFFLIVLSLYSLSFKGKLKINPTKTSGICVGIAGGVAHGLFSIAGPITALYLIPSLNDNDEYLATIQASFVFSNTVGIIIRVLGGKLALGDWKFVVFGWIFMMAGTILGRKWFSKVNSSRLNTAVYIFICLNGLWIIINNLFLK